MGDVETMASQPVIHLSSSMQSLSRIAIKSSENTVLSPFISPNCSVEFLTENRQEAVPGTSVDGIADACSPCHYPAFVGS